MLLEAIQELTFDCPTGEFSRSGVGAGGGGVRGSSAASGDSSCSGGRRPAASPSASSSAAAQPPPVRVRPMQEGAVKTMVKEP